MTAPVLVAAAHGTRDGRDQLTIEALLARVRALRPGLAARAAYIQFAEPSVSAAIVGAGGAAMVVPLLLSTGYHVRVDLPAAIRKGREVAGTGQEVPLAPALGPHPLLADALVEHLDAAGWQRGTPLVLAAAGSTDLRANADVQAMGRLLARRTDTAVLVGYASGTTARIADVVTALRRDGARRVAVASYLIAPGRFHDIATAAGADLAAAPLADHEALARLVLRRYDRVAADLTGRFRSQQLTGDPMNSKPRSLGSHGRDLYPRKLGSDVSRISDQL